MAIITFSGGYDEITAEMREWLQTQLSGLNAQWVEKSIGILSNDMKTTHDGMLALQNDIIAIKQAIGKIDNQNYLPTIQEINVKVKELAEKVAHMTTDMDDRTKPVYKWDLSVDGIGITTKTNLPYAEDYLVMYKRNGVSNHILSVSNIDIRFFEEDGNLAYAEKTSGLGLMEIYKTH